MHIPRNTEDILKTPLGKMKRDIFLESDVDDILKNSV